MVAYAWTARGGHDRDMTRARIKGATPIVVFDLAVLRFEWGPDRASMTAWSPGRKLVGTCGIEPGTSDREAVFKVLDQALDTVVEGPDGPGRPALYNPFTAQIAYGSVPSTLTFTDREPLELDTEGTAGYVEDGVMVIGDRRLESVDAGLHEVEFAFAAHRS
jgi:hypothetical protein